METSTKYYIYLMNSIGLILGGRTRDGEKKIKINIINLNNRINEYYRNKLKIHAQVSSSHPKLYDPTAALASNYSGLEQVDEDELDVRAK